MELLVDGAAREGAVMWRTYEGCIGWEDGAFCDRRCREEHVVPRMCEEGLSIASRFYWEENPPLSDSAATVAEHPRYVGEFVRVASVAAASYTLELALFNPATHALSFCVVVNEEPVACAEIAAGAELTLTTELELDSRRADIMFVPASAKKSHAAEGTSNQVSPQQQHLRAMTEGELILVVRALHLARQPKSPHAQPEIFVVGDSIAQSYPASAFPQTGWGQALVEQLSTHMPHVQHDPTSSFEHASCYTTSDGVCIHNLAIGGRSARSYRQEGHLTEMLEALRPGDVVLIQFGANDATAVRPSRYTPPEAFGAELARYVWSVQDRGATPVIVTAPPRYHFDAAGHEIADFAPWSEVERSFAAQHKVALCELSAEGAAFIERLGKELAAALFLKVSRGQYTTYPDGIDDSTHLSAYGAATYARIVARTLCEVVPSFHLVPAAAQAPAPDPASANKSHPQLALRASAEPEYRRIRLSWEAMPSCNHYQIECRDTAHKLLFCAQSIQASWTDILFGAFDGTRSYTVSGFWDEKLVVQESCQTEIHIAEGIQSRRLGGCSLYEVDHSIEDRIGFSVRFCSEPALIAYKIIAQNTLTSRQLVLETIDAAQAGELHSYSVNNERGWVILVQGIDTAGATLESEPMELASGSSTGTQKQSWEMPF